MGAPPRRAATGVISRPCRHPPSSSVSSNPSSSSPPAFFCAAWNGAVVPAVVAAGESAADATAGAALLERLAGVAGGAQITRVLALWASNAIPLATASVAHSLAGVALGLVLVFRTNSSFARLTEARVLLGNMVRCARDLARLAVYVPGDSDDGARARTVVVGYAASIGFALEAHVRRGRTREDPDDPTAFRVDPRTQLERVVGAETADAYVSGGGNVPLRMHAATSLALRDALAGCREGRITRRRSWCRRWERSWGRRGYRAHRSPYRTRVTRRGR